MRKTIFMFFLIMMMTMTNVIFGGSPEDQSIWEWTPGKDYHSSIVKVYSNSGAATGVVVEVDKSSIVNEGYMGYILTASHVITAVGKTNIMIEYHNNKKINNGIFSCCNEKSDIALISAWIPIGVEAAVIASSLKADDFYEICGLGGGVDLERVRHFKAGKILKFPTDTHRMYFDALVIPGDSGGPVYNSNHELVGIISGGWKWLTKYNISTKEGRAISSTWPANGSSLQPIIDLIKNKPKRVTSEYISPPEYVDPNYYSVPHYEYYIR